MYNSFNINKIAGIKKNALYNFYFTSKNHTNQINFFDEKKF